MPLRTTNAFLSRALVSAAGMSTCHPVRSRPLNRLRAGTDDVQANAVNTVASCSVAAFMRDDTGMVPHPSLSTMLPSKRLGRDLKSIFIDNIARPLGAQHPRLNAVLC